MATGAGIKSELSQQAMGVAALGNALGDLIFVDSNNGNDGNDGLSRRRPVKTLTQAISLAGAGDTIILEPGGSETITSGLAISNARTKVICPVGNPEQGFAIKGAGTLDLLTVSGANVTIEGVAFKRTAAAGSTTAGVSATAAADGLLVKNCLFDYTDITGTFTNYGVEIIDDCNGVVVKDCIFKDAHRAVFLSQASGKTLEGARVEGCEFWVGQSTAFGVHANSNGNQRGVTVKDCVFIEADGDGSSATDAWDGTDGTDAASGPINFGANVDQGVVVGCVAYNASGVSFDQDQAIASGASVELIGNRGAADSDLNSKDSRFVSKNTGSMASGFGTSDSPVTLFTVTGDVMCRVFAVVQGTPVTSVSGNGTLAIGTAESTGGIIAASNVDGTQFAATDVWVDATPANDVEQLTEDWFIVGGGANIILTIATADMSAGDITFYCEFKPLSADGNVVAA